jgi:peptidoglycan/LPS O-acetylase OafA/YrhL
VGDVVSIAFLAVVVLLSRVTYRWIEVPGRRWLNGLSDKAGERLSDAGR